MRTRSEWVDAKGKKLLDEEREHRFFALHKGIRIIDATITLRATQDEVVFGDTKEGTFAIRVAGAMKEKSGGKVVSSRGLVGAESAWGKPAEWIDYVGKVDGEVFGIAILDHPTSFRHPTHWHVRDYGLFAANPFGYKPFYSDESKDGSHQLKKGEAIKFRYRVVFHRGDTHKADIEQTYRGFARPPKVEVARNDK